MNLRHLLLAILMMASNTYASVDTPLAFSDLLISSKDPSILGIRHLYKDARKTTRGALQKSFDELNGYSEDQLKNPVLASEILVIRKKIEDFDKEFKHIDSNLQDCLSFLINFTRVNIDGHDEKFPPS